MATASLSTSPTQIDAGSSDNVSITNTGAVDVVVARGAQSYTLRPTQVRVVYPEGVAVTAATVSGSGSVSYTATAARLSQQAQFAADPAFTGTYVRGQTWANLPMNWNAAWKAAKAAQATTPAWLAVLGDSVASGQGSTDWLANGWFSKLRTALIAAGNTLYGDFYPAYTFSGGFTSLQGATPYTTISNSPTSQEAGYGRSVLFTTTSSTTFTTPYACTAIDIVYIDYGSGTWTYIVDGGSPVTVTTTNANNINNSQVKKVSITGLTLGTHTVVIGGASSNTNVLVLVGVSCYVGTTGIGFVRSAYPAIRATDLHMVRGTSAGADGGPSYPVDKIGLWGGINPGGTGGTYGGFGFPTQPAAAIIAYGINDVNLGAPIELFRSVYMRQISALRRGYPDCSLIFLANAIPNGAGASDDSNPGGRGYDWGRWKSVMREFADTYGGAYVDIDAKWNALAYTRGYMLNNDVHPTDAGHADIAAALASIL